MEEQQDKDCYHNDCKSGNPHERMKYIDNPLVRAWTISWLGFGLSDQLFLGALSLEKSVPPFVWLSSLGFASGMILCQG
jgi:hypothetical protein